ncbi:similar to Torulaspora delbrueckii TDEL_0H03290 hypothetical protein [Maudiozyma saulgeensis]|uniref:Uncharacterized protein n=1 Tax=Maudiozyma saulgeensis TaxID=1789683 RepID=A0A1X7R2Y8_9SACH|nr:similar to Torulaspora delbrueckii TDEL_0H03290 hypothetical protein [Kazachstania saulgeensis]
MNAHINLDYRSDINNMNEIIIPPVNNTEMILTDIKEESNIRGEEEISSDIDNNNHIKNNFNEMEEEEEDDDDDNKTVRQSTLMVLSSVSSATSSDPSVIIHHHHHHHQNSIENGNIDDSMNNNDNTNGDDDISVIKDTKDGEVSIPLSTSSIAVDKFVSNEELVLLPPLPNEIDLQLDTQNLTGSLTNSSNNENNEYINMNNNTNNMTTTIVTDSFTPGSLLDPSSLTSNSTPETEIKSIMLLPQETDNNSNNVMSTAGIHIDNTSEPRATHAMMNVSQGSPLMLTPLSEDGKSSPTDFNNVMNTSFDLSKAFEMSSSPKPTTDSDNTVNIVNTIPEHKRLISNSSSTISHKQSSILTKRVSNKSVTPVENKEPTRTLRNEEKIYQVSNINQQENNKSKSQHGLPVDLSTEVYIPYVSDSLSTDEPDLTPLTTHSIIPLKNRNYNLNNEANIDSMSIASQTTTNKKLPFLRRASSTLLRKASMKSLSRQDSNLVCTPRSSGTTPILASPSQFESNIVRTRSNSVLQETNSRRKPTMKRNVSFGSRMKRSFSRIVSNGASNNTENTNTPTSPFDSERYTLSHSNTNDMITPTKPDKQSLSNIQSPLDMIRQTHSYTPTPSSMSVRQPRGSLSSVPGISTPVGLKENSAMKPKQQTTTSKFIEINTTLLRDTKFVPATNITDQIVNDSKTLDKIIQQSKLCLLPSSYGSSMVSQHSTPSLASSNSNKQDVKLEKFSIKEYVQLLKSIKDEEIKQYDAIIKNLEIDGWYSTQEIDNMTHKKDLLNKLWRDRISFYQNQM